MCDECDCIVLRWPSYSVMFAFQQCLVCPCLQPRACFWVGSTSFLCFVAVLQLLQFILGLHTSLFRLYINIEFLFDIVYGLFSTATTATLQQNWWKRTGAESLEMPMDTGFHAVSDVSDRGVFLLQQLQHCSSFWGQKHPFRGKN